MHILGKKLNMSLQVEHPMPGLMKMQYSKNDTKGSMPEFSKLQGIKKLVNYNYNESGSMPPQNLHIVGSTLKGLTSLGSDIHVKSIHYLFMQEGCSVSKELSLSTEEIRSINSTLISMEELNSSVEVFNNLECLDVQPPLQHDDNNIVLTKSRMELLNSSTGCFISPPDYSDTDDLQLEITLKDKLPFLRSTHYYRLSNSKENNKDSRERKILVLFDGFRCFEQMSILVLGGGLNFHWSYLWSISHSQLVQISVALQLTNCVELFLDGIISLESFPSWILHLVPQIKRLSLRDCRNLRSIPDQLPTSIQSMYLCDCIGLQNLPSSIKHFSHFEVPSKLCCKTVHFYCRD
ncbi:hypothetical protein PIB30_005441 [Stylosanthes scabra]|uniref:Uncharacterized protein n=1 Tax=Stylosanthes scabra TaxID=79078 RepID=A0ABU6Y3C0_9FABA|nr:hypothetical protein [Stylosanthes scabra]